VDTIAKKGGETIRDPDPLGKEEKKKTSGTPIDASSI